MPSVQIDVICAINLLHIGTMVYVDVMHARSHARTHRARSHVGTRHCVRVCAFFVCAEADADG